MPQQTLKAGPVHPLPNDFRTCIEEDVVMTDFWNSLTPLARNEWICWVTSANQAQTRARRITVGLSKMRSGEHRPCCWAGCPHREKNGS